MGTSISSETLVMQIGQRVGPILINAFNATDDLVASPGITWATTSAPVATVDGNGYVTGVGAGTCNITATSGGNIAQFAVVVSAAKVVTVSRLEAVVPDLEA